MAQITIKSHLYSIYNFAINFSIMIQSHVGQQAASMIVQLRSNNN